MSHRRRSASLLGLGLLAALAVTSAAAYGHRRSLGPLRASRRRALVATVVFASVVIAEELLRFAAPTIGGPLLLMPYEVALASVKQSHRAVVPDIRGPLTFESWLDEPRQAMVLMLVEPGASTST